MTPVEGPPGLFCPGPPGPVAVGAHKVKSAREVAVSRRPIRRRFANTGRTPVASSQGPRRRLASGTDETATITVIQVQRSACAPCEYHMGFQAINKRGKLPRRQRNNAAAAREFKLQHRESPRLCHADDSRRQTSGRPQQRSTHSSQHEHRERGIRVSPGPSRRRYQRTGQNRAGRIAGALGLAADGPLGRPTSRRTRRRPACRRHERPEIVAAPGVYRG